MSKVLLIEDIMDIDAIGRQISENFQTWETLRAQKVQEWEEVQRYLFATDTTKTTNSSLPWSNKTTMPKLCNIRDNITANYLAVLFPKRKWLVWEGATRADEDVEKKESIESYMSWTVDRNEFYDETTKLVLDYVDYGNCFCTIDWLDGRNNVESPESEAKNQIGFVGPMLRRISPLDIVFNPTAASFHETPKIVRSIVSIGEAKEMLERESADEIEREAAEELYKYLKGIRDHVGAYQGHSTTKDVIFQISGFSSYADYLQSGFVEILTFYGDIYVKETGEFFKNQIIKIVDRHKILVQKTNPSFFGYAPIYHAGWRVRPDNLWAMGPLDNLVGMQYRIDHLENMKADVFDLIAFPPFKVKGYVGEFNWGPGEKIICGDDGDVDLMSPKAEVLNADNQISILSQVMEEMAGSPKEAMGFRTPGEKTMYEVQRLENAASRIFQAKVSQFERQLLEQVLNGMLELARRRMDATTIRGISDEFKQATFQTLTAEDITGQGRIRPVAARHFAEKSQQFQNLSGFFGSTAGQDPAVMAHFSSIGLARLYENLLELEDDKIVEPFIRLSEQADMQRAMNVNQEQVFMEQGTPSGLTPDDTDELPPQ